MERNDRPEALKGAEFSYDAFENGKVLYNKKKNRLPAMGWNSWNAFGSGNTEALTKAMADKIVELGLDKLGYKYVVLDDGCYLPERVDGKLANENVKFPSGFKALGDYIHDKGLKFGMYNDIGTNLCAGAAVGTYGHESGDASAYLEWGVDFIKVDNCYYMWDNATFSNPENARYVYAPRIKNITISKINDGQDKDGQENVCQENVEQNNAGHENIRQNNAGQGSIRFSAVKDGHMSGKGLIYTMIGKDGSTVRMEPDDPAIKSYADGYVENIGTFDGTNTGTTPVGVRSGELVFDVNVPEDGEYELRVEYATGKNGQGQEPGVGEWLQIAVDIADDSCEYSATRDTLKNSDKSSNFDCENKKVTNDASEFASDKNSNKLSRNIIKSKLYFDDLLPVTSSKDDFIWSEPITIFLKKGNNKIRLMNHRRQENTLNSYAELLKGFNDADPDNDVVLSICEWGKTQPQNWGYKVGDSWRILNDITFWVGRDGDPGVGRWFDHGTPSVTSQYNKAVVMDEFAGLDKGWNDPDMMMIGMNGITDIMCKTHMAMWCMMNSPLMLGLDLRRVKKDDWIYRIIANKELIALNQDSLGIQAKRVFTSIGSDQPDKEYITNNDRVDILVKPLSDGGVAVSFINVSERRRDDGWEIKAGDIPFESFIKNSKYTVTDLWTGEESVNESGVFRVEALDACDNVTIRIRCIE